MSPGGIKEPVDVSGDGVFGSMAGLPCDRPDQLRLDGLEEGLDHQVVVAVPLAVQGVQDAVFSERNLIVDRAVLRSTIGMMDQPRRRIAVHNGATQSLDCEVALQSVTRRPADDPPRRARPRDRASPEPSRCRRCRRPSSDPAIRLRSPGEQVRGDGRIPDWEHDEWSHRD